MKVQKKTGLKNSTNKPRNLQRVAFIGTGTLEDARRFNLVQKENPPSYNMYFKIAALLFRGFMLLLICCYILICLPGVTIRKFRNFFNGIASPDESELDEQLALFQK